MASAQAVNAALKRLERAGWVRRVDDVYGRRPLYVLTRAGNRQAEPLGTFAAYLPRISPGTITHTLLLGDLLVGWSTGRLPWPREAALMAEPRIVTEREIRALDASRTELTGVRGRSERDDGLGLACRRRRGGVHWPDMIIAPEPWAPGDDVVGAICVEVELSRKSDAEYKSVLDAMRGALKQGRYAGVLYLTHDINIRNAVVTTAQRLGIASSVRVLRIIDPTAEPLDADLTPPPAPTRRGRPRPDLVKPDVTALIAAEVTQWLDAVAAGGIPLPLASLDQRSSMTLSQALADHKVT